MNSFRRFSLMSFLAAGALAFAGAAAEAQVAADQAAPAAVAADQAAATVAPDQAPAQATERRGPATNLPLPRFVTLKASEANVRRGPSLTHRIDWVFTAKGMPLEVVGEYGHWRRVRDQDGVGGWVHYTLLSGARAALVKTDQAPLFARADPASTLNAKLETGVILSLMRCGADWCQAKAGGIKGWVAKADLWGVGAGETFE